jgi:hypothetical protein
VPDVLTAQPTCATPARSAAGPGRQSLTAALRGQCTYPCRASRQLTSSGEGLVFYDQLGCGRSDRPAKGIRDAELVIFEDSSHMAFIEERGPYIQTVSDFLTRAEAGPPPG